MPYIRKLLFLLIALTLFLTILHFLTDRFTWIIGNRFNLDAEASIPMWFSSSLLFCVSLASFGIYFFSQDSKANSSMQIFWLGFGVLYLFLSMDEAAALHEIFDKSFHLKWIYVYAPIGAVFFLFCAYFLVFINKSKHLRNWILGGLIVFALGGVGGKSFSYFFFPSTAEILFEEGLEMLGTIFVLRGCLEELSRRYKIELKTE